MKILKNVDYISVRGRISNSYISKDSVKLKEEKGVCLRSKDENDIIKILKI